MAKVHEISLWKRLLYVHVHCNTVHNSQEMDKRKYPPTDKQIKRIWYMYTTEHDSTKKGWTLAIYNNVDGTGGHYVK